jgi:hypothetical protein
MTRCQRCQYALVRERCPVCAGRKPTGVPVIPRKPATVTEVAVSVTTRPPLYWSPAQ